MWNIIFDTIVHMSALSQYRKQSTCREANQIKISIVMPVLNEEKTLPGNLEILSLSNNEELIVVDGGSTDRTVSVARNFTDKVFVTKRGRGHQMNYGADRADGDILLFLHADYILPDNGFSIIREVLKDGRAAAGAFDLSIDHPKILFRLIESAANLRSRLTSIPYGDQGLFMAKKIFDLAGGFADIPLMEDIEISKRLKKIGDIVFVRPPIKTSPRRWLKEGRVYATLRNWTIAFSYVFLGISPKSLKKYYREIR